MEIKKQINKALKAAGVKLSEVELYVFRPSWALSDSTFKPRSKWLRYELEMIEEAEDNQQVTKVWVNGLRQVVVEYTERSPYELTQ